MPLVHLSKEEEKVHTDTFNSVCLCLFLTSLKVSPCNETMSINLYFPGAHAEHDCDAAGKKRTILPVQLNAQ